VDGRGVDQVIDYIGEVAAQLAGLLLDQHGHHTVMSASLLGPNRFIPHAGPGLGAAGPLTAPEAMQPS
jgi:hypothetical protein